MTPEEIRTKYGDDKPVIDKVRELRLSPNGLRVARPIPEQFIHENKKWISVYFMDMIGLTVSLLSDKEVANWRTVWRSEPSTRD